MNTEEAFKLAIMTEPAAWFEGFGAIQVKGGAIARFPDLRANYLQLKVSEIIAHCVRSKVPCRMILLKPRQKGCSTFSVAAFYRWLSNDKKRGCIIGGAHDQGDNLFKMLKLYSENDGFAGRNKAKVMDREARWPNGSRAVQQTARNPEAGRSGTFEAVVATEVARWAEEGVANAADVLAGLLKCVPDLPGTLIILESTASGACYDDKTDILTDKGWMRFCDLVGDEKILTKNRETGVAYYQPEWKLQKHYYSGDMVAIKGRAVDLLVTPNHSMWVARQKGPFRLQPASSMLGTITDFRFERTMKWDAPGIGDFILPPYRHRQGAGWRTIPAKRIPVNDWLDFMGMFLSEGHVKFVHGCKNVQFSQTDYANLMRAVCARVANAIGATLREENHGRGKKFTVLSAQLADYLRGFTKPKRIPRDMLMNMSSSQCIRLLRTISIGDGEFSKFGRTDWKSDRIYCGKDKTLQDDVMELALKAGYGATCRVKSPTNLTSSFSERRHAYIGHYNPPKLLSGYDGFVYCATLPKDHLLMVRRNGRSVWCGNSGDFYNRWQTGITFDELRTGRDGFVKVFAPWFVFEDAQRDPAKEDIASEDDYAERERELARKHGLTDRQVAWMRWAIREECKGDFDTFCQDYPFDEETAFLRSGRRRFNTNCLSKMKESARLYQPEFGVFELQGDNVVFRQTPSAEARVMRWEQPREGCAYLQSVDVMTGASQASGKDPDNHAALLWRKGYFDHGRGWVPPRLVCRLIGDWAEWERNKKFELRWDIDVLEEQVWRMSQYYGNCLIAPEMNMDRGMAELLKLRGANIYEREQFNRREQTTTGALGWVTNAQTREMAIETLARHIREYGTDGGGVDIHCPILLDELGSFIVRESGRSEAMAGKHDDNVLSAAIGLATLGGATAFRSGVRKRPLPRDLALAEVAMAAGGARAQYW